MAAQVLLALGIVLVVLLVLVARARTVIGDERHDARAFVSNQIDEHIEGLAAGYLEARSGRVGGRPGADHFGREIELFIGDVLLPRAERCEPWLREALREILVLERDAVYGEIEKRVETYLRQPSPAEPPARRFRI